MKAFNNFVFYTGSDEPVTAKGMSHDDPLWQNISTYLDDNTREMANDYLWHCEEEIDDDVEFYLSTYFKLATEEERAAIASILRAEFDADWSEDYYDDGTSHEAWVLVDYACTIVTKEHRTAKAAIDEYGCNDAKEEFLFACKALFSEKGEWIKCIERKEVDEI